MIKTGTFKKLAESSFVLLLLAFCIIVSTGKFSYAAVDGVKLFFACVFPAVFPYLFLTAILSSLSTTYKMSKIFSPLTKKLFNTGGLTAYAFLLSTLSGYPMGAKTVADLRKSDFLGEAEAQRAAAFCSSSSPVFLVGSVGNVMFGSPEFGLCLFACSFISSILCGLIFSFYKRNEKPEKSGSDLKLKSADNLLYDSVYSAVISVLLVGGLITVFYILSEIIVSLPPFAALINGTGKLLGDRDIANGIFKGLLECTSGLKGVAEGHHGFFTLPVCAGFGGLSVIAQSVSFLKSAKIKTAPFLLSKLLNAVLSFVIGILFSAIFFRTAF